MHGSYERIESGLMHECIRDLTGAPGKCYMTADTENLFEIMLDADQRNYILAAGTNQDQGDGTGE